MNKKTGGYRGMLRDRCPKTIDRALKWQKAKDNWVEHAYCYFIKIVGKEIADDGAVIRSANESKRAVIKVILGLRKGKTKDFNFHSTIDWDNLSDEDTIYWKRVESWVNWFRKNYIDVYNRWEVSMKIGDDEFTAKVKLIRECLSVFLPSDTDDEDYKEAKFMYVDKLANFLIKCCKEDYV